LTIPLIPLGGNPIGALQLINCKTEAGKVVPFRDELLRFVEALGAQAATILYNLELLEGQKQLLDSTIQIIAGAIDAKSPYTGGHCKRVPELALMIVREANNSTKGSFADFGFRNEDEWREFSIGAWLHDCGKVVTPEYVVDKATKLETIYNRIHEIRTRFEVLLRDARVAYYKGLWQGEDPDTLHRAYEERKQDLLDKFAFVAGCNTGGDPWPMTKLTGSRPLPRKNGCAILISAWACPMTKAPSTGNAIPCLQRKRCWLTTPTISSNKRIFQNNMRALGLNCPFLKTYTTTENSTTCRFSGAP
jgi:hypothetical protein